MALMLINHDLKLTAELGLLGLVGLGWRWQGRHVLDDEKT